MKLKKMLAMLLIVVTLAAIPATSAFAANFGTCTVGNCNEYITLRAKPSTSAAALAHIPAGAKIYKVSGNLNARFLKCQYAGMTGYVLRQYVLDPSGQGEYGGMDLYKAKIRNCDSWVSLRTAPNTSATRICKIPKGATVYNIYYVNKNFVHCTYNGHSGFIMSRFINF